MGSETSAAEALPFDVEHGRHFIEPSESATSVSLVDDAEESLFPSVRLRELPRALDTLATIDDSAQTDLIGKWQGVVEETDGNDFVARLTDLFGRLPDEYAQFSLDDVAADDRPLVTTGAVFYVFVTRFLTRMPTSRVSVRFRRLPRRSRNDRRRLNDRAAYYATLLDSSVGK